MSRRPQEEEDGGDNFMVLFTALSMILLAFFIMLNSLSTMDDARTKVVVESVAGRFGVMPGYKRGDDGVDIGRTKLTEQKERAEYVFEQAMALEESGEDTGVSVRRAKDGRVIVRLDDNFFLGAGRVHVPPSSFDTLDRIIQLAKTTRMAVRIEGHSDPVAPSGAKTNWYLSTARAATVYRYMYRAGGMPLGQMTAHGYEATRPDVETGVADRRVELTFLPSVEWRP